MWGASGTGTLFLPQLNGISVLDATISRDGPGAAVVDSQLLDPLRDLTTITSNGGVTLRTGASLTTPGPLTTAGAVHIGALGALSSTGLYKQTGRLHHDRARNRRAHRDRLARRAARRNAQRQGPGAE